MTIKSATVGELRVQSAYQDHKTPVEIVSRDPEVAKTLAGLRVVKSYPDTRDAEGNWASTFKIEVEKR
jgi:hypothetical protein